MAEKSKKIERLCPICEKVFFTTSSRKKYCTPRCRKEGDRRLAAEWYIKNRKDKSRCIGSKATCEFCGEEFTRTKRNQYYCTTECMRRAGTVQKKEEQKNSEVVSVKKKHSGKTDWGAITKICAEHNLSYGQAQRKGLLEGL